MEWLKRLSNERRYGLLFVAYFILLSGVWYMRNDKLHVSSCMNISVPGYYMLSGNLSGNPISTGNYLGCMVVNGFGISLDCDGHSLVGNGSIDSIGIYLASNISNIGIYNCSVSGYERGIVFDGSGNSTVINTIVHDSNRSGFMLYASSGNMFINNTVYRNGLDRLDNVTLDSNGFYLDWGSNLNMFINNTIHHSGHDGIGMPYSGDNILVNNTISFSGDHGIGMSYSGGNFISGNHLFYNRHGIDCTPCEDTLIKDNNIHDNTGDLVFETDAPVTYGDD